MMYDDDDMIAAKKDSEQVPECVLYLFEACKWSVPVIPLRS
jgi:hypothetical protein